MATLDYELWDLAAGDMMGAHPDQASALAEVRAGIRDDGAEAWRDVGLRVIGDTPEESRRIAVGKELMALALSIREQEEISQPLGVPGQFQSSQGFC